MTDTMSTPRRSARLASLTTPVKVAAPKECPPAPKKIVNAAQAQKLINEMDIITAEAFQVVHRMSDIIKERAARDDVTAGAIVWLTRLSWAIEDCREYKMRQLTTNCDETVIDSIPHFFHLLRILTADATCMLERFQQQQFIPRSFVVIACSLGISIKDSLYNI